ncbi:hypothetical protein I7I53_06307 [Histoplasma capsulatum var. duboisii H88]|uniref:Uncharacterized protein n=1 Tax=Ajellomyces capsulatus (strain H88) TaxID=544711 RepID=A0A8A1L9I9_AJEC8|nr:hypothetical protein I7I53_06307 [Histoplasma capsulatum var. duboisii H88]
MYWAVFSILGPQSHASVASPLALPPPCQGLRFGIPAAGASHGSNRGCPAISRRNLFHGYLIFSPSKYVLTRIRPLSSSYRLKISIAYLTLD